MRSSNGTPRPTWRRAMLTTRRRLASMSLLGAASSPRSARVRAGPPARPSAGASCRAAGSRRARVGREAPEHRVERRRREGSSPASAACLPPARRPRRSRRPCRRGSCSNSSSCTAPTSTSAPSAAVTPPLLRQPISRPSSREAQRPRGGGRGVPGRRRSRPRERWSRGAPAFDPAPGRWDGTYLAAGASATAARGGRRGGVDTEVDVGRRAERGRQCNRRGIAGDVARVCRRTGRFGPRNCDVTHRISWRLSRLFFAPWGEGI